ncbi:hypothetical protein, partial [Vibrio anguillarum]|uniref:hypothetical protein n=1 Tax=Vibrio anguillarum TaxID=55601 RepID=UPI00188A9078
MIIRARPKYLLEEDICTIEDISIIKDADKKDIEDQGFYFNRGSSALKFVLENVVNYLKKDITVCIQ